MNMFQDGLVSKVIFLRLLEFEGIKLEVKDLESLSVYNALSELHTKLFELRQRTAPHNVLTYQQFIEAIIKNYKFTEKEQRFLLAIDVRYGTSRRELIVRTHTRSEDSLRTLKFAIKNKFKKYQMANALEIVGTRTPEAGYRIKINTHKLNVTIKELTTISNVSKKKLTNSQKGSLKN